MTRLLAIIPARGGSKGLPGKNIKPFLGIPLIAHSIMFARMCPKITRSVVSTDSSQIAEVARLYGADVPFLRPAELAEDRTPVWSVLRHALSFVEEQEGAAYDAVLLLDPTSPARERADVTQALGTLDRYPDADGVIGVSQPDFNPVWHCVIERDGWMNDLVPAGALFERRQEAPAVFRINGTLYLWRAQFVRTEQESWRRHGKHRLQQIPDVRGISIDDAQQFAHAELLVREGTIKFPWLPDSTCAPSAN